MAVLLAHQAVTNPATVVGPAISVPNMTVDEGTGQQHRVDEVRVEVYHAFNEEGANTNTQSILIQTSISDSGNGDWVTPVKFTPSSGSPVIEVLTDAEIAGATVIRVADEAGSAAGDLIYIRDTVVTDSEWALVQEVVVNTSIDLVDGLTTAHAATTTSIFTLAEKFSALFSLKGIERIRLVYMNEALTNAANTHVQAEYVWITTD